MNGFYQQEKPGNFSSLGFFLFFFTLTSNITFVLMHVSFPTESTLRLPGIFWMKRKHASPPPPAPPPHSVSHCQAKKTFWQPGLLLIS